MSFSVDGTPLNVAHYKAKIFQFSGTKITIGHRNNYLTGSGRSHALRIARMRDGDVTHIFEDLNHINDHHFIEPLPEKHIFNIAKWASNIQLNGQNRIGLPSKSLRSTFALPIEIVSMLPKNRTGQQALFLLCELCRNHPPHHVFSITSRFINRTLGRSVPPKGKQVNANGHAAIKNALLDSNLLRILSPAIPERKCAVYGFGSSYLDQLAKKA